MQTSFFGQIQSLLLNKASGRYLSQLIRVVVEHDPDPMRRYLRDVFPDRLDGFVDPPARAKISAECEESLYSKKGDVGRMDVTVRVNGRPYVRIEIKYDDRPVEKEIGDQLQLKKYISWCKHESCRLLILTKNPLSTADRILLAKHSSFVAHKFHASLGPFLAQSEKLPSVLLLDYLQDKGLVMNKVDTKLLYSLLHRLLNHGGAKVSTAELRDAPAQLSSLMHNMALIADDISPKICKGKGAKNRKPTIDFGIEPWYTLKGLRATIEANSKKESACLGSRYRDGGYAWVSARHTLDAPSNYLQISYGFAIYPVSNRARKLQINQYASIWGTEITKGKAKLKGGAEDISVEDPRSCVKLVQDMESTKGELVASFQTLIAKAILTEQELNLVTIKANKIKLQKTRMMLS